VSPVALLESEDMPGLSFLVTDPRAWYPDYQFAVSTGDLTALEAATASDLDLLVIATVSQEPFAITFNLLGPLVVNRAGGRGRQVIQHQKDYAAAHQVGPDLTTALNSAPTGAQRPEGA
jgi:flagellar assembly factor FliW